MRLGPLASVCSLPLRSYDFCITVHMLGSLFGSYIYTRRRLFEIPSYYFHRLWAPDTKTTKTYLLLFF
jgi:hypothetical protein